MIENYHLFKRPLYVGAHVDDVELFAGGTIKRFPGNVLVFSRHKGIRLSPDKEVVNSMAILGVPKTDLTVLDFPACQPGEDSFFFSSEEMYRQLDKAVHRCQPTVVVTHQSTDTNQDHKFIHDLVRRVVRRRSSIICGSFYYNDIPIANRQLFVELDQFQVQAKVNAVQCYESQYLGRQYLSPNAIHTQAKFYGLSAGCEYAEAFEVLRMVV